MSFLKLTLREFESVKHTRSQLSLWGVDWPPSKGWKQALLRGLDPNGPAKRMEALDRAEEERLSMKKLYQEKSGDYNY